MGSQPVRSRVWRHGKVVTEDFPFAEISDHLEEKDSLVWVDLTRPDHDVLMNLAQELSLDPNAIEDAVSYGERPKLTRYRTHKFVTAYSMGLQDGGRIRLDHVSAFILPNALITVHKDENFDIESVVQRWDANSDLTVHGVGALVHGLLDWIVDNHFDVVQRLDDEIETLEDGLFADKPQTKDVQMRSFQLRKSLVAMRRVVLPMREVVGGLYRRDGGDGHFDPALVPYFEDLYDHVLRVTEWTESLRDLIATIFETNLSLADERLNTVMKKLTSWAAIIAVPTAITGFYGQNVPYPGFQHTVGFWTSTLVIVALVAVLYVGFRRRGWL